MLLELITIMECYYLTVVSTPGEITEKSGSSKRRSSNNTGRGDCGEMRHPMIEWTRSRKLVHCDTNNERMGRGRTTEPPTVIVCKELEKDTLCD